MRKIFIFLFFSFSLLLFGCSSNNTNMTTVKSKNELLSIIKDYNNSNNSNSGGIFKSNSAVDSALESSQDENYSKTNTQVEGIDEEDIADTDGENIYLVSQKKVVITKVHPVNDMEVIQEIKYEDNEFMPTALYAEGEYLIVIGHSYEHNSEIYYGRNNTRVFIYDKSDFTKVVKDIKLDGNLKSTRLNGDNLLIVTNKYVDTYLMENNKYYDARVKYSTNDEEMVVDYNDIHYKPGTNPTSFVSVLRYSLSSDESDIYTYLGSCNNVYVSDDNIYLAQNYYNYVKMNFIDQITGTNKNYKETFVTKIPYIEEEFKASKTIEVKGHINDQFSMDEYNGYFRIATTKGDTWNDTSSSNLYIYNDKLDFVGEVGDFAKGERIQSVRFVGDKIYIVTFRTVDPFFVIDAKDVNNPIILGELKLPGFSTYLHPYDDNHIIGFGFETIDGRVNGLKMTLFDVTEPNNPIDKFSYVIPYGNGYSYSELSYNHKALLYNRSKGIIGFPFTRYSYEAVTTNEDGNVTTEYKHLYKQSYQIFSVDLENGFDFKEEISHFDEGKENQYTHAYIINRGFYIDDNLYTVSLSKVQAHSLTNYDLLKEIELDFDEQSYYYPN